MMKIGEDCVEISAVVCPLIPSKSTQIPGTKYNGIGIEYNEIYLKVKHPFQQTCCLRAIDLSARVSYNTM
jgi:hypothetical protein